MDSFNITIASYGFLINYYPIYDKIEPKIRTHKIGLLATLLALLFTVVTYYAFAHLSVACFGIENIRQNILGNFDDNVLSIIVKLTFLVIFLCAIPFNFFPLKVCALNFIEELKQNRISK